MSKTKKLIIIAASILVVVAIGVGIGWGFKNSRTRNINFNASKYGYGFAYDSDGNSKPHTVLALINSLDELKDLCRQHNNPAFDNYDYKDSLINKIRGYDETFFEDKALIIDAFSNAGSGEVLIEKFYIENGVLNIGIVGVYGYECVVSSWVFFIEVNKEDIINVTDLKNIYK